ncbi:baseplate multidomain protein megatron [Pseudodonghicola flavimaris]|uniref:Glycoside hydrolase/phage tail family protein n=1 Tax=Pseudodonghicola flavimaris TaxID=3050036 RepID=A0ABT7F3W2_9RHOB|nr:glycoside hydrolase/phage tail family protein [Pseudodonghicola flavimaris]MDK3019292.1 glycoside hydrolase/phage tail family protein [Pseudodonghicola flavimaris]
MATIVLSAAGVAVGGSVGGTLAGLSSVVIGRAVGATLGRLVDQRLLGLGAEPVESGKVDRFRLLQAGEGGATAQVYGRMRVGGQVIWATDFQESVSQSGGGKGSAPSARVTEYSYSVSLAVAVCEGEVRSIGRVWADGEEMARGDLNMRVYPGSADQLPDPLIEAVEGEGAVPAYRGTAYVVIEDLDLGPFGNRVPQLSFEVLRAEQPGAGGDDRDLGRLVRGVALMPGTGEYALATTTVYAGAAGAQSAINQNTPAGMADFPRSFELLQEELPACSAVSLVVSWFGDDLRCGACRIVPKVEQTAVEGSNMAWQVSGVSRAAAAPVTRVGESPVYGGTPADAAVVEAIRHMRAAGTRVMFYPFILMDQLADNGLIDPWSGEEGQPALPWRGRITLSRAPGVAGSPDGTAGAEAEVAAFFGTAAASDFAVGDGTIIYSGPEEWGLRRFILHYAALCAAAGGVEAFCIGSELRGLTQIRGVGGFPAVAALRDLAAEVRQLLGPEIQLGYAADWSEYFGYQPGDGSGDRYFHLDPLWADAEIDFVGIDNYMPLSDWRDGRGHLDAQAGWESIYDPDYLDANVEGGEGFDWYYHSDAARAAQIRTPIADADHAEPWLWRYKDLRGWWENAHHERIGGVRQAASTAWEPQMKPIWFTELGCAAIDRGTNQPNKFLDPKSSESALPYFSTGARDDLIQLCYLQAQLGHWDDPAANPVSEVYGGPMLDLDNAYVWAWDARPFPAFPARTDLWNDGDNYARGHWLNGRVGARSLASVVTELCRRGGVAEIDVSELHDVVRGFAVDSIGDIRAALQLLMLRYGFDAIERDGRLLFRPRSGAGAVTLDRENLAVSEELDGLLELSREADGELAGRVQLQFVEWGGDHEIAAEEAVLPDEATHALSITDLPLAMTRGEARAVTERWLSEARVARDSARLLLPPSQMALGAGDTIALAETGGSARRYRIDRVEQAEAQLIEAVRIEPAVYTPSALAEDPAGVAAFAAPVPVLPLFLDLPLITGDEQPQAPHLAVTATPWPGAVALYSSASDENYALDRIIAARSVIGVTETPLAAARTGLWDEGHALQVRLLSGALESREALAVLNGANLAAIGDGTAWELFQFRRAELVASDTYLLSGRLRGQAGSDGVMPAVWPVGSWVVLLDGTPRQIGLTAAERRVARHYRIGVARRGYDDPSYVHLTAAFDGVGLRPYRPCHLQATREGSGDIIVRWLRRSRLTDGSDWTLAEVPLGEEREAYRIRVLKDGALIREETVLDPLWHYPAATRAGDGLSLPAVLEVAQISARFGAGPAARITLTA